MPMASDGWDFDPDADLPNETYRGVRRADTRRGPRPLVVGIVLVLVAAGLAWFALSPGASQPDSAIVSGGGQNATGPAPLDTTATGPSAAPTSSPAPTPTGVRTSPSTAKTTTRPFTTLVYEAEAGMPMVKLRSAQVVDESGASGGKVVVSAAESGQIQFRSISIPTAGNYRFSIYYAPSGARGTGNLSLSHDLSARVTFASGSGCCLVATVDFTLPAGTYSANLQIPAGSDSQLGIDRMTISQG